MMVAPPFSKKVYSAIALLYALTPIMIR